MLGSLIGKVTHMGGTVTFDGQDISQTTIADAVRLGIVLVPEKGRLFRNFTVEKNLRLGGLYRARPIGGTEAHRRGRRSVSEGAGAHEAAAPAR